MTQKITIPDLTYSIAGDVVELQQSIGCGEFAYIDVHKIHLKLIAEQMNVCEPTPANMSEIVKTELMELLEVISEHWEENGNYKHLELELLTQSKALYQKALSVCRIAGCDVAGYRNDGSINEVPKGSAELALESKGAQSMSTHDKLSESSASSQSSLLEVE